MGKIHRFSNRAFALQFARLCVVLLVGWLALPFAAAAEDSPPLRVLILLGSDYTLPASVVEANAIRVTLAGGTRRHVEFYTEALDANGCRWRNTRRITPVSCSGNTGAARWTL
jgi:hypothetical protein